MGQKTNPIGLRLKIVRSWDSLWYANRDYATLIEEDLTIKKYIRNPVENPIDRDHIIDECGDVLYYLCKILHWVDADLNDAMQANEEKINERYGNPAGNEG